MFTFLNGFHRRIVPLNTEIVQQFANMMNTIAQYDQMLFCYNIIYSNDAEQISLCHFYSFMSMC